MKIMTLKEIQKVNLELMSDIHEFCVQNCIDYSLAYGSLIGAVRHNGFIPWDDDIDIMMTRPNFERFSKEYVSKRGFILSSVYDKNTYINYTRVYDNRTIVVSPAKQSSNKVGIWVDVFPIDAIPDDQEAADDQFRRLRQYTLLVMKWRYLMSSVTKADIRSKLYGIKELVKLIYANKSTFAQWHKYIISICKENNFGLTKYCSSLVCVEANIKNRQEVFFTKDFQDYELCDFEEYQFFILKSSDSILKTIFGEYMIMPPKEKQVSHVLKKWKFYWKNI